MDREIKDLQSEFETERFDYLETIRRQEQQLRLLHQIIVKVQPLIRKDSNYRLKLVPLLIMCTSQQVIIIFFEIIFSDLDNIKQQCIWVDEFQRWKLPEVTLMRVKLPPTTSKLMTKKNYACAGNDVNVSYYMYVDFAA